MKYIKNIKSLKLLFFLGLSGVNATVLSFHDLNSFLENLIRIGTSKIVAQFADFFCKILVLCDSDFLSTILNPISKIISFFLEKLKMENHFLVRGR